MNDLVRAVSRWREIAAHLTELLGGLFYPNVCQICLSRNANSAEGYVCADCRSGPDGVALIQSPWCEKCGLPFEGSLTTAFECANCRDHKLHFRKARAAVKFGPVVQQAIVRYKYNQALWFEPFLCKLHCDAAAMAIREEKWDYIVPIPLHWRRRHRRGFNQAERLARALSRTTGIPLNCRLLRRVRDTPTQTRLTRSQRLGNVEKAFRFRPETRLTGERIILVDDVLTTGATASACARELISNGAGTIDVWTVARGLAG